MKKITVILILIIFADPIFAQSTIQKASDLDERWNLYFLNGDVSAITEIIKVLDWNDEFRMEINSFLSEKKDTEKNARLILLLNKLGFKLNNDNTELTDKRNIGALSFILLPDEQYGPIIKEILSIINSKQSTLEQMIIMGAATWSLKSNCEQHPKVKQHILDIYKSLGVPSQIMIDYVIIPK